MLLLSVSATRRAAFCVYVYFVPQLGDFSVLPKHRTGGGLVEFDESLVGLFGGRCLQSFFLSCV